MPLARLLGTMRNSSLVSPVTELTQKTTGTTPSEATSLSLFRMALEAAVAGRYADWLRLISRFKAAALKKESSLSLFDKRLIRWVETKGRTLGCEERDRRFTMRSFHDGTKSAEEMNRDELLFHFLDTLDDWSAKLGHLMDYDEVASTGMRRDALSKLQELEWADAKTILRVLDLTKADLRRLEETELSLTPRHRLPSYYR